LKVFIEQQDMYRWVYGLDFVSSLLVHSTEGSVKNTCFYLSLSVQTGSQNQD